MSNLDSYWGVGGYRLQIPNTWVDTLILKYMQLRQYRFIESSRSVSFLFLPFGKCAY